MCTRVCLLGILLLAGFGTARAEVEVWKLGGDGLRWIEADSSFVFIDFADGAIQPRYLTRESNILSQLSNWSPFKFPAELGYVDGEQPRIWRAANGFYWYTAGTLTTEWVDGDSLSYSPPISRGNESEWYTLDVGVPVPAESFGFFTPPRGFRADGTPLSEDIVKAFEVSISAEADPVLAKEQGDDDYHRLQTLIADIPQNFDKQVKLEFPKQYVRFMRFKRNVSIDDLSLQGGTWSAEVQLGTFGEFVLHGEGVPKRVYYTTKITDLGREWNFGRLFWSATPLRRAGDQVVEAPEAQAFVRVEVRSGRDEDPNLYREFTDTGGERVVSRERYEKELKKPDQTLDGLTQAGKPGLRASVGYDTQNWTYWSFPLTQSGVQAPLQRGRYLQVRLTLESQAFADYVRLDSLWLEMSPPLAEQVQGEVARLDEPNPAAGLTRVSLGEQVDFTFDLKAQFSSAGQQGFDAVRIRTGSRSRFVRLEMGDPLAEVAPSRVEAESGELVVYLPRRVVRSANSPLRVTFGAEVFLLANAFAAEVFDAQGGDFPQQVEAGDVTALVNTNSLQVLGMKEAGGEVIRNLRLDGAVFTPNGDGINDQLVLSYTLFRLPSPLPVRLYIYSLDGVRRAEVEAGLQGAGPQRLVWDGRDGQGLPVPPGFYLMAVVVDSERGELRRVQPVGIAY
ncbi:MAG: hypothetical protein FJY95_23100 [Candidatus Handelsmanbacteria bacterium]|nr:hypothetical protein [Candidatus Handelsmanbacteria bacterium]